VSDPAAVAGFVEAVLAANAKSVADFSAGKENALKFLVGQVMKASRGTANPALAEQVLRERLQ
jgi:aspartyl-tRNA(Asn)/glutamyl-tRNA(Gln) amidotransferase subunit B